MGKYLNRLRQISNFNYCPVIWHSCSEANAKKVEIIHERALKFVYNENYSTSAYAYNSY